MTFTLTVLGIVFLVLIGTVIGERLKDERESQEDAHNNRRDIRAGEGEGSRKVKVRPTPRKNGEQGGRDKGGSLK